LRNQKTHDTAITALFMAIIIVLDDLQTLIFTVWPFPIKPTILMIPVIIASIVLGPKIGATLGGFMGIVSVITATVTAGPTNFLFSPFQAGGDWRSLIIAIVPRILIGIFPYFIYKAFRGNKIGLPVAGVLGAVINTVFVLGGIFVFFGAQLNWTLQILLGSIIASNSIAEFIVSGILVTAITPTLLKVNKR
jgi:uncharacterized membrane protein